MNEQKMNYEHVLSPIKIGPMTLKNRVSFTPVWPSFATADGHVNRELIEWVRDIVKGGAACINIGCGCVNRNLPPFVTHLLRMSEESVVNEMTILSDLVHMYQCKIGIELFAINMYGGNFADRDHNGDKPAVELDPTYMTKEQIKEYIEDFALAAERAVRCGVDSLVIHGAHGQLPGCFLNKRINERTDEYGADTIENASRFTVELLAAVREKIKDRLAIEYRINANDMIDVCDFGRGGAKFNQIALRGLLEAEQVKMIGGVKMNIEGDRIVFVKNEKTIELSYEQIILSLGVKANEEKVQAFADAGREVVFVGDCNTKIGTLYHAVHTAHEAASVL